MKDSCHDKAFNSSLSQATEILEGLIDKFSLGEILELIGDICHSKADHILTNWQDKVTARWWEKMATSLETFISSKEV